jgi:serine/threonine-protein phosphatase 2A activator
MASDNDPNVTYKLRHIPSMSEKTIVAENIPRLVPRKRRSLPSNPIPIPETPLLPPPPEPQTLDFQVPTKRILSLQDHQLFLSSPSYGLILAFIFGLSESVVDRKYSSIKAEEVSARVTGLLTIFDEIEDLVKASPPDEQGGSRFGNKAFRGFLDLVGDNVTKWHQKLGINSKPAIDEVSVYLMQSFGNRMRIDYGSGHELNFAVWLLCLYQLRVVTKADFAVLVLKVFTRYLELMRLIQSTYYLEPAGSHGVWGLDDYQFLPFLFGASQLLHHPFITPRSIHQELTLEQFGSDYMYLGQVCFVNSTKNVKGLRWHSPMLDDISAAKSWEKIEAGMRRMFIAEVLSKLPVMQHFLFGSLVPAMEGMSADTEPNEDGDGVDSGHVCDSSAEGNHPRIHQHSGWGDCCGIKVPSSIAALQEQRKNGVQSSLRRIPFD